ncbi:CoA pyrophosphatase [Globicatella sulfidifaciens]|uniref:CoA pyrophosphatase n=1 Tax=Globicatella sulfidifaciens TaxID=136093 RepID=A0A7X8H057_9LACT|nr:CoA pyrophosphatase [Globicatella sulfidifaciens]NLJ18504.1 CoA pyrophosphatase [Globicatella sulfidifaciens]
MLNNIEQALMSYQAKPISQKRTYAVLLPLIEVNHEWHVLYEVRSEHVPQPGDVSFPGGAVEANESLEQAAIRETTEELNLSENQIQILGEIDYIVNAQSTIHCFIGRLLIDDYQQITPNEEVAKLFSVSLKDLINHPPRYYKLATEIVPNEEFPFNKIRNGKQYRFSSRGSSIPFYDLTEDTIWGMTAQLTHRFTQIITETQNNNVE